MQRVVRTSRTIRFAPALVCALALTLLTGVANASVAKDEYCDFLVTSDASIHSGPGAQHPVIGSLSDGTTVNALRRAHRGFHHLGRGGYVARVHLQLVGDPARCG